jgi:hypothetical protein
MIRRLKSDVIKELPPKLRECVSLHLLTLYLLSCLRNLLFFFVDRSLLPILRQYFRVLSLSYSGLSKLTQIPIIRKKLPNVNKK